MGCRFEDEQGEVRSSASCRVEHGYASARWTTAAMASVFGGAVSDPGRLRHGKRGQGPGDRRRMALMSTILCQSEVAERAEDQDGRDADRTDEQQLTAAGGYRQGWGGAAGVQAVGRRDVGHGGVGHRLCPSDPSKFTMVR